MSALFGKKARGGETTLIIDVENGSVASALAHISRTESPRLFGERRVATPVLHPLSSTELANNINHALEEALIHTGEVAARLRHSETTEPFGIISQVKIFLSAPWTTPAHGKRGLEWAHEPRMISSLYRGAGMISDAPVEFVPFARAAAYGGELHEPGETVVCVLTGEVLEVLLVENGHVTGRATAPLGIHTILRTLQSHADLSLPEARSALKLAHHAGDPTYRYQEPLRTAADHLSQEFSEVASELLEGSQARSILVIAPEHVADWFARSLTAHPSTASLFPGGGSVRTLRTRHFSPHLAVHSTDADVPLMLEAMFINAARQSRGGI